LSTPQYVIYVETRDGKRLGIPLPDALNHLEVIMEALTLREFHELTEIVVEDDAQIYENIWCTEMYESDKKAHADLLVMGKDTKWIEYTVATAISEFNEGTRADLKDVNDASEEGPVP
jgi:hypothetical protein